MKKGFTLIELLAVIVILAIIALIATPIVLDIIDETKRESLELSAQNYIEAVELSISNKILNDSISNLNGVYEIINSGKQIKKDEIILDVPINGELPKEGYIVIDNSKVTKLSRVKLDKWDVKINGQVVKLIQEEEKLSILVTGQQFNEKIKTLVNGEGTTYKTEDQIITSIVFYSDGILPTGYTKEKLEELPKVDVSLNGDIIAYNDNGKIYVCSENIISLNPNASYMFYKFKSVMDIKFIGINTGKTTNMYDMFLGSNSLISVDTSRWDTSNVTTMQEMFYGCSSLITLDTSKWNTSKVKNMAHMFYACKNLATLDVSKWDTSNVTAMYSLFKECENLIKLDVSKWNTSNVTSMASMFAGCSSLTSLDVSNFNTSKVISMDSMFSRCKNLIKLDVSKWNTGEVTNMSYMFSNCQGLTKLDVSNWNTNKVTIMERMLNGTSNLTTLDVSKWDTSKVTSMEYMFASTSNLKPIFVGNNFGINATKNNMFRGSKTTTEEELCEPNSTEEWCTLEQTE